MKIEVLGTGTSQGVPVIGCTCEVCQSDNAKDKRLRCSVWIANEDTSIVIDTGPDFRQQMLRAQVDRVDAILLTHEHNDHIIGIDDVRPFNFRQKMDMPVYAVQAVQDELKTRFDYVFKKSPYPGAPRLLLQTISDLTPFKIGSITITPIQLMHGDLPVLGFRVGDFTYITDANSIAPEERAKIKGSKYLVLNALHHKKHHSHFNLTEALEMIEELAPEKAYLTHVSHFMGLADAVNQTLPPHVQLAYDGLKLDLA